MSLPISVSCKRDNIVLERFATLHSTNDSCLTGVKNEDGAPDSGVIISPIVAVGTTNGVIYLLSVHQQEVSFADRATNIENHKSDLGSTVLVVGLTAVKN